MSALHQFLTQQKQTLTARIILLVHSDQELQLRPDPERLLHEEVRPVRERRQEEEHPCRAPLGMNIVN